MDYPDMHSCPVDTSEQSPSDQDLAKGIYAIAVSMFGIAFSFNCIMSFMPFYILEVSAYPVRQTMLWTGMIIGAAPLVAAVAATFWGGLSAYIRPKFLFQSAILYNAVIFFIMGFAKSLPVLLTLRIFQGILGGASTIGLVLIAGSVSKDNLPKHLGLFQNAMTAGQLVGPPLGAYIVALFGYRYPFYIAVVVLGFALLFCHNHVRDVPIQATTPAQTRPITRRTLWGWGLIVAGTIHLTFLPSILPHILEGFQLTEQSAIKAAGTIMMAYMATAIVGNYLLVRIVTSMGLVRLITIACLSGAVLQVLLYFSSSVYTFTVIRVLQTGMMAAVIPLVISSFAKEASRGTTLGFLNSGRFIGNALGPILATSILGHYGLLPLYLTIAVMTLVFLAGCIRSTWS